MATTPTTDQHTAPAQASNGAELLVSLGPLAPDTLAAVLANLAQAFPQQTIIVATPSAVPVETAAGTQFQLVSYNPPAPGPASWLLSAADYLNCWKLADEHHASACLLLGPEAQSLRPQTLRALADAVLVQHADLATPHYDLSPRDGLVNSAILYPVTRALFAARSRYPLAVDLAFSARLAERLATLAQRYTASGGNAAVLWPVAEAAVASFTIAETPAGPRALPPPGTTDLNTVLAQVAGSLFAEVDARASFWQRARLAYAPRNPAAPATIAPQTSGANESTEPPDVTPMLESFRLAYANLHEIWSLVLPPNSLLGLKKLSLMTPESFRMPDPLWARIVYDFTLAYRLRTLNRGHLLGALTPLYLAWVASHLLQTTPGAPDYTPPEKHIEAVAAAFEADKPYLVSRWRWPDRFNP
jgi:hypothetical protein